MAGLQIQRFEDNGTITLRLAGRFDAQTAGQLSQSLADSPDKRLVLDFSHVREFMDSAVAVLARGLFERDVRLKGLVGHQERMFRYFGFPSVDSPRHDYYIPEPQLLSEPQLLAS